MAQFSMEIMRLTGSVPRGNQQIVLAELKGEKGQGIDAAQTFIGNASAVDVLKWGAQRPASTALVANQFLELLLLVPGDLSEALRIAQWLRTSRDGIVLATGWENFTRVAMLTGELAPLMADTITQLSYLGYLAAERDAGRDCYVKLEADPSPASLVEGNTAFFHYRIFIAVVVLMARDQLSELPLAQWRADLPTDPSYDSLRGFLTDIERVFFGPDDPWINLMGGNDNWLETTLAALGAMNRGRTAGELLVAQSVAAHCLNKTLLCNLVGGPFSELVASAWKNLLGTPALLATPRVSVPAIQAAISNPSGWRRTKSVFQAALLAVPSDVARYVRGDIATLPDI